MHVVGVLLVAGEVERVDEHLGLVIRRRAGGAVLVRGIAGLQEELVLGEIVLDEVGLGIEDVLLEGVGVAGQFDQRGERVVVNIQPPADVRQVGGLFRPDHAPRRPVEQLAHLIPRLPVSGDRLTLAVGVEIAHL